MKFLIHGNAPWVQTGYGIQIAHLATALKNAGHDVAISSTYGLQGGIQSWRGIRVYQCGYETNSNDLIHGHADHWFAGDDGWIVTLIDVWAMENPLLADYNVAAWVPIDHFPIPDGVLNFFSMTQAVPVAMSQFGHQSLFDFGLDPVYIPLSVDTAVYHPTEFVKTGDGKIVTGRDLIGGADPLPDDAFTVGMVAMNKGWARDRKGFNEAFWAFGQFIKTHPNAVLYMHTDKFGGAQGINLDRLRVQAGIPDTNIRWADQYAYRAGYTGEMMAAVYTAMDVLLAPSHGEGFCVPLIEAQACGTPVLATDFSAQAELINNGWPIMGQPEHNPAHHANYVCPLVDDVLVKLHDAYNADRDALTQGCIDFAGQYDTARVFDEYWRPFIAQLEAKPEAQTVLRDRIPDEQAVAVVCPALNRPDNVNPLVQSFRLATREGEALLYFVVDADDHDEREAVEQSVNLYPEHVRMVVAETGPSFAQKLNDGYRATTEPWLLVIGDDVRFHAGWLDAARKVSDRFDVIGTNDTAGKPKNRLVASGAHADHFFVRRQYIDDEGACLDGPGVLAPEAYRHWYTDMEIVKLAKARGVFTPCLDSIVEHLHPGYDGDENARAADPTYMLAVEHREQDAATWNERLPLIQMQRVGRAKI